MAKKEKFFKVGARKGRGVPPGYQWNVDILDLAFSETMAFLDADQYAHMARQVQELAMQEDPTHSDTVDVQPIEAYFEIRDKGGILKKLNVRVYFCTHKPSRTIGILGAINKKNDGATPVVVKVTMRQRMRRYLLSFCS